MGPFQPLWSANEAVADISSLPLSNRYYFSVQLSYGFVKGLLVLTLSLFPCIKVPEHMAPLRCGRNSGSSGTQVRPHQTCLTSEMEGSHHCSCSHQVHTEYLWPPHPPGVLADLRAAWESRALPRQADGEKPHVWDRHLTKENGLIWNVWSFSTRDQFASTLQIPGNNKKRKRSRWETSRFPEGVYLFEGG